MQGHIRMILCRLLHWKQLRRTTFLLLDFKGTQFGHKINWYPPIIFCLCRVTYIFEYQGSRVANIWFCQINCSKEVCMLERLRDWSNDGRRQTYQQWEEDWQWRRKKWGQHLPSTSLFVSGKVEARGIGVDDLSNSHVYLARPLQADFRV